MLIYFLSSSVCQQCDACFQCNSVAFPTSNNAPSLQDVFCNEHYVTCIPVINAQDMFSTSSELKLNSYTPQFGYRPILYLRLSSRRLYSSNQNTYLRALGPTKKLQEEGSLHSFRTEELLPMQFFQRITRYLILKLCEYKDMSNMLPRHLTDYKYSSIIPLGLC